MTTKGERYISRKIPILMDEGYPQKQAIAIAYSMARERGYDVPKDNPGHNPGHGKKKKKESKMPTKREVYRVEGIKDFYLEKAEAKRIAQRKADKTGRQIKLYCIKPRARGEKIDEIVKPKKKKR